MGLYAIQTKVPIQQTKAEIERVLEKYKASGTMMATAPDRAMLVFEMADRRVRFDLPLPAKLTDQQRRSHWRALLLTIKAKLESVATGIETFEEAFLAHIVLPDGGTVLQHARPRIEQAYKNPDHPMPPLLPGPQ